MPGGLFATQLKVHAGRNEPKIRNDVLLDPWMDLGGKWQRNVKVLITIFGDECQNASHTAKPLELGITEISNTRIAVARKRVESGKSVYVGLNTTESQNIY